MLTKEILERVVLLFLVLTFLCLPINAEDIIREGASPSFEVINRESGLSNLSVSAIVQDRDGFLWFGTQGGLNRYDGREFKLYSHDPFESTGLLHNLIQTLFYDEQTHILWIGSYQGLSRFDIALGTFSHYTVEESNLSNPVVVSIEKDHEGNIWAGTLDGLNRLDVQTQDVTPFVVSGKVVRDIHLDSSGILWLGTHEGLQYFDFAEGVVKKEDYELPTPYVMVVNEFDAGELSLGLWDGGVVKINLSSGAVRNKTFEDNRVYSYSRTEDGTEWVGTWGGGLFATTPSGAVFQFKNNPQQDQLPHDIVYSLLQDESGILWIGTNGGGIAKVNPLKRNYVTIKHLPDDPMSLSPGKINAITKDDEGNLWIAVYNEGLNRISLEGDIVKYMPNPEMEGALQSPNAVTLYRDSDESLLIGAGNVVYRFDAPTEKFEKLISFEESMIVYAIERGSSNELWIGTYRDGVFRFDLDQLTQSGAEANYKLSYALEGLSDNLIYDILMDSKGRLWVATNNGLNLQSGLGNSMDVFKRVSGDRTQLASNTVRVIFEDSRGVIWIGMVGGGVAYYNEDGTFTSYVESDGMPSNTVLGILEGDDGRIWVSTQNGLAILTPGTRDVFVLTPEDGIGGYEFNSGYYKDSDDVMYFGGVHGITAIPGNISGGASSVPRLYITGVDVNQVPYNSESMFYNGESLLFTHDERFVSFTFIALDYDAPDKVKYNYRLLGYEDVWINANNLNSVSYSKLPPGQYTFQVFAETARGLQSSIEFVEFSIATPWYASWWAYTFYFVVGVFLIYSLVKMRESYILANRNIKLAQMNDQLEEANNKLEALSTIDALTGLYNRRYLTVKLEDDLKMAIRGGMTLSVLMLDLDNFKSINDTYGHVLGDQYLIKVGDTIKNCLNRGTDFGVRYGGDEFMVVLFDTDEAGALLVGETIRQSIENLVLVEGESDLDIQTTTSMGLMSIVPTQGMDLMQLIKLADEALYEAKRHGKNMITVKR